MRRPPHFWLLAFLAASFLLAGCSSSDPTDASEHLTQSFVLLDGSTTTLGDLLAEDGRPLVINLWATWCAPCLEEMPDFEKTHQTYKDEVRFVGINISDSPARAAERIDQLGITYLLGADPDGDFLLTFGAVGLPATAFISADGTLIDVHMGRTTAPDLVTKVEELLS
jgi:thiol-disulfide isomerase/thioredoxin